MKYRLLILCLLLFQACTPRFSGYFEGDLPDWVQEIGGGEYPVDYYRFKRSGQFDFWVLFCMLTERGSGRYKIVGDSIRLKFKFLDDPKTDDEWEISDTTIIRPFKVLDKHTILIDDLKFRRRK